MSPRPALGRRRAPSGTELHRSWLALVDTEGPFLTLPALLRVWPQANFPGLDSRRLADLKVAKASFEAAHDAHATGDLPLHAFRGERDAWVEHVLRDTFGWGDHLVLDEAVHTTVASPTGAITATSTAAFRRGDDIAALVWVVDPVDNLRSIGTDGWATDTIDRFELMLRASHTPVGVVTDGRWWGLVSAQRDPKTGTSIAAASGIVDAFDWVNDPAARHALAALLAPGCLAGGQPEDRLAALFRESVTSAELVTEALGAQVRRAVELIVQAFSESALDAVRRGEPDPLPEDAGIIYDAAVTVMMRVVFLLFAEERGLLPSGELFRGGYGLTGQLDKLRSRAQVETPEGLDATSAVWHRLLATSRALYRGASFEDLRLPTYGGSLFDPERFPFLAILTPTGELALAVDDRVMMQVLDAVQMADVKGEGRRPISFRDIDVEQIGYIYEGLLGYTCRRAPQTLIGLIGKAGAEAEIPLSVLNDFYEDNPDDRAVAGAILGWVKENQPSATTPTVGQLTKALAAGDTIEDADVALRAVTHDPELADELRGWLGIIRRDLRDRPTVITQGGLVVVETPSRKNAGAHYTPRSLAEEVVLHALEPLVYQPGPHQTADRARWVLKSPEDILELKVADIACGSGAFLVAAARYLAARLVEAWDRRGSGLGAAEQQKTKALREVVARCLYGADINPMAIEMCKLSLWLVSLDPKLPFSFVDDKVLVGNSLLGITDLDQVRRLHIDPTRVTNAPALFEVTSAAVGTNVDVDAVMARALRLRQELASEVNNDDPQRSAHTKSAQLAELRTITAQVRDLADGVIAAGLRLGGKPGKALDAAYADLRIAATDAYPGEGEADRTMLDDILKAGLTPTVETDYDRWQPVHWPIELPDVFARGGFDAVVGNPPFLGGKKISLAMGSDLREWFVNQLAGGAKGNADIIAYFFLRATSLIGQRGTLGLIATNTLAQGDTREVGLDRMVAGGFTITRSIQSRPWPASSAVLEFAAVWGALGPIPSGVPRWADGTSTQEISTLLEPKTSHHDLPRRLATNRGVAFKGVNINGLGFLMTPADAAEMIAADSSNANILRPYFVGADLNQSPTLSTSRWIVDFGDMSYGEASLYSQPMQWVRERVPAQRGHLTNKPRLQANWWRFEAPALRLRSAKRHLHRTLAIAVVSKTVMPVRVNADDVYSQDAVVFATDSFAQQAVVSSSLHQMWAIKYGSGMRTDPRYTPSDVFETFPRPAETDALHAIGRTLDEERREIMLRRDLGLTKLYNLVNDPSLPDASDPDVARLRAIHVELDEAVMAAYGWSDVSLDHGFHAYRQMTRWTISPSARVEILDRLLEENHRRAAAEAAGGMGAAPTASDAEDDFDPDAEEDEA